MLAPEDEVDVEVAKDDQARINEFGRLSMRKHELEEELKALKTEREETEMVDEAVLLAEEAPGALKLMIGQILVDVDTAAANDFIERERARMTASIDGAEAELRALLERQMVLKAALYAKFGKSINLEE